MAANHSALRLLPIMVFATLACLLAAHPAAARDKQTIWSYDGGVFLETDGTLSTGPCFRVAGRVSAPDFFENLKRIDNPGVDTVFRRGKETVTQFPAQLLLHFVIHDLPCSLKVQDTGSRKYLTRTMVSDLRLSLYWKHGVELRSIKEYKLLAFSVRRVLPFNPDANDLPEKLEWNYELDIPTEGAPLTDSLVLIIRTPNDQVAARVAARM